MVPKFLGSTIRDELSRGGSLELLNAPLSSLLPGQVKLSDNQVAVSLTALPFECPQGLFLGVINDHTWWDTVAFERQR